jgi:hypothetical protein
MRGEAASSPSDETDLGRIDTGVALESLRKFIGVINNGQEWEEAGCTLWDIAVLPEQATTLVGCDGVAILQLVIESMVAAQNWRAAEISVGTLANMACHPDLRGALASNRALAQAVVAGALWAEDGATVLEACRLASTILSTSTASERALPCWHWQPQATALGVTPPHGSVAAGRCVRLV